jgi:hypothetical protein
VRPSRQSSPIVIGQAHAAVPKLSTEEPILFDEVGDHLSLRRPSQPVSTRSTIWMAAGIDHEAELISRAHAEDVG